MKIRIFIVAMTIVLCVVFSVFSQEQQTSWKTNSIVGDANVNGKSTSVESVSIKIEKDIITVLIETKNEKLEFMSSRFSEVVGACVGGFIREYPNDIKLMVQKDGHSIETIKIVLDKNHTPLALIADQTTYANSRFAVHTFTADFTQTVENKRDGTMIAAPPNRVIGIPEILPQIKIK